jgi:hypothetical protein
VQTVTVPASGGTSQYIYGTTTERDAYLAASYRWAATWATLTTADQKNMASVDVARMLDRQSWLGTPTLSFPDVQKNQWPRDGVGTVGDVVTVDGVTPKQIDYASYELAAMLVEDPDILDTIQSSIVEMVKAGSAQVKFFAPQTVGRFAQKIMELLVNYMAGGGTAASAAGEVFGNDGETAFDEDDGFGLNGGL